MEAAEGLLGTWRRGGTPRETSLRVVEGIGAGGLEADVLRRGGEAARRGAGSEPLVSPGLILRHCAHVGALRPLAMAMAPAEGQKPQVTRKNLHTRDTSTSRIRFMLAELQHVPNAFVSLVIAQSTNLRLIADAERVTAKVSLATPEGWTIWFWQRDGPGHIQRRKDSIRWQCDEPFSVCLPALELCPRAWSQAWLHLRSPLPRSFPGPSLQS